MLTHYAYQMVPSTKRGAKGQEEKLVEQAVRLSINVKNRQTKAQDEGMALLEKKIEEKKLEKSDDNNGGISSEQFTKMNYHERAKLFKENPEQYAELSKNN